MEHDIRLALMTGIDIPVPECQLTIHQPTIKEISMMGENDFNLGAHLVCVDKKDYGLDNQPDLNNFTLLMKLLEDKEAADKKQTVKQFLLLILPQCSRINITSRSIFCNKDGENLILDEGNFESFQIALRKILCMEHDKAKDKDDVPERYNPANDKARAIADKIYAGRNALAKIKAEKNPYDSMLSRKASILAIGVGYTMEEINKFTIYQVNNLCTRMTMKMEKDMDDKIRLAGGKPDKSPPPWIGPI